jgi:hypothetical protein
MKWVKNKKQTNKIKKHDKLIEKILRKLKALIHTRVKAKNEIA